ncbi:MAG TPA: copper amine oxidase N-terminal domain-containing protein [Clostridia bacterium]
MKKIALIITVIFVMATLFSTLSFAVELPLRVVVNGDKINFPDAQPFIDSNGRTQTPARFIGEALGATVTWDSGAKKAEFVLGDKKLVLYIAKKDYDVNGEKKQMDTAALLKDGRTFVPARYVAEAFGATVKWDSVIRTVYVNIDSKATNQPKDVGGFKVPADTNVIVTKAELQEEIEAKFGLNLLDTNFEKQKYDLKEMLLQKFESDIVDEIITHISKKNKSGDVLPEKVLYSKKNDQYIWIKKSVFIDINVIVYVKGYKY